MSFDKCTVEDLEKFREQLKMAIADGPGYIITQPYLKITQVEL